jgi:hypothetical protein
VSFQRFLEYFPGLCIRLSCSSQTYSYSLRDLAAVVVLVLARSLVRLQDRVVRVELREVQHHLTHGVIVETLEAVDGPGTEVLTS